MLSFSSSRPMLALVALTTFLAQVECIQPVPTNSWTSTAFQWGLLGRYPQQIFKSSPLRPPLMDVVAWDDRCAHGYTLLSLRGSAVANSAGMMLDGRGDLVWMDERYGPNVMNLKVQKYRGEQYITFWAGDIGHGFGLGTYYMLDSHYEVFKQFSASSTLENDFHEYTITANDTALLTSYDVVSVDLSSLGVNGHGWIYDSLFREISIETGELIFEWRASDHFAINDTFYPIGSAGQSPEAPFDFFHINSIDKDGDGNYLISSRFMHSIACISAGTGKILWTLGGRNNDFADLSDGKATDFAWQHHVSVQSDNRISIFDNAKYKKWYEELLGGDGAISRGMLVQLDKDNMTVRLIQEYLNPGSRGTPQQGSMQVLDSGNVLLGWGFHAAFTEYAPDGTLLCDTHINPPMLFPFGFVHTYRAARAATWVGRPQTRPDVYLDQYKGQAFVSWMGATEVAAWVVQTAKATPGRDLTLTNAVKTRKDGFETRIQLPTRMASEYDYLRINAVNQAGNVLASSRIMTAKSSRPTFATRYGFSIVTVLLWTVCLAGGVFFRKRMYLLIKRGQQKVELASRLRIWREGRRSSTAKTEEEERLYTG